jgi:hypothetical protein
MNGGMGEDWSRIFAQSANSGMTGSAAATATTTWWAGIRVRRWLTNTIITGSALTAGVVTDQTKGGKGGCDPKGLAGLAKYAAARHA